MGSIGELRLTSGFDVAASTAPIWPASQLSFQPDHPDAGPDGPMPLPNEPRWPIN